MEGSLLWQEILGNHFFRPNKCACLPVPKESDRLLNPY